MPALLDSPTAVTAEFLDRLAQAGDATTALRHIDEMRCHIAGRSVFSIQQNVTGPDDPADEIRLRRFYSSEAAQYPVNGGKLKTLTPWTDCLFRRGQVFVGEGADVLAQHFDDYERMRGWGLQSVVNVPLMQGLVCYATFNVFGTAPRWLPQQLLSIRLLALAAARWVPAEPGLCYRFTGSTATRSPFTVHQEA